MKQSALLDLKTTSQVHNLTVHVHVHVHKRQTVVAAIWRRGRMSGNVIHVHVHVHVQHNHMVMYTYMYMYMYMYMYNMITW